MSGIPSKEEAESDDPNITGIGVFCKGCIKMHDVHELGKKGQSATALGRIR